LYGCGTWSLALREEHRLRAFEDRVFRWMLRPKKEEVPGAKKRCVMRSLTICAPHQIIVGLLCQGVGYGWVGGGGVAHVERWEHFCWRIWKEEITWRPDCRWENNVKNLEEISWSVWTGFIVAQDRRKW
jgi:hypothetical protein